MRSKYCSFCGTHEKEVERLIDGPASVAICNECIELMHEMLTQPSRREPRSLEELRRKQGKMT